MMKRIFLKLPLAVLLICNLVSFAQPDDKREKLESLKRQFISTELNLTVAESEKFWPLYNEFETSRKSIRKAVREAERSAGKEDVKEKDLQDALNIIQTRRKEEADLDAKFVRDMIPVIGVSKAAKLLRMEDEFRRRVMDEMRDRKKGERYPHSPRGRN